MVTLVITSDSDVPPNLPSSGTVVMVVGALGLVGFPFPRAIVEGTVVDGVAEVSAGLMRFSFACRLVPKACREATGDAGGLPVRFARKRRAVVIAVVAPGGRARSAWVTAPFAPPVGSVPPLA